MKAAFSIFLCAMIFISCDENSATESPGNGTWILYEHGYSPGAGYITENVPAIPTQTLTLNPDGSLETTVTVWKKYKYYLIIEPGGGQRNVLALYEEKPSDPNPDLTEVNVGYNMVSDEDGNLKLYFRWCIEGCHMAFKRYGP